MRNAHSDLGSYGDSADSDADGAMQIVTANGTFSYTEDWNRPSVQKVGVFPTVILFANAGDAFAFRSLPEHPLLMMFKPVVAVVRRR